MIKSSPVRPDTMSTLIPVLIALLCMVGVPTLGGSQSKSAARTFPDQGMVISNLYYRIVADPSGISSLQVDSAGTGTYGSNIIKRLFIKDVTSTNGAGVVSGKDHLYFTNLSMSDGTSTFTADWQITLDGPSLKQRTICSPTHIHPATAVKVTYLTEIPWNADGYITNYNGVLFKRFITDAGQYLPVQMLKRLAPGDGINRIFGCNEIIASGTEGYDMRFAGNMDMGYFPNHFTLTKNDSYLIDLKINLAGSQRRTLVWDMAMEILPHTNRIQKVGIQIPTFGNTNSSVTLLLREGGPSGDTIIRQQFDNVPDNSWQWLSVPDLPPGKYYLEMRNPYGAVGWPVGSYPIAGSGATYIDGKVQKNQTRWIKTVSSGGATNEIGSNNLPAQQLGADQTFGQTFVLRDEVPEYYPEFFTSGDQTENRLLNEFFYHAGFQSLNTTPSEMEEWMALKTAWTDSPLKSRIIANFQKDGHPVDTNGYVYTQGRQKEGQLLERFSPKDLDARYFRNNPMYILAIYRLYTWTGDTNFLTDMMPKLRAALEFIKTEQHGNEGLAIIDAAQHDGVSGSWGASSYYFETLPFGNKDALLNVYFYAALRAMADLELAASRSSEAVALLALADTVKANFNTTFWDSAAGRYVGCIDVNGVPHDYGYTFINLQAIAYGLASADQQTAIFQWLENEPTSSGARDTFSRWVISPRTSTINNPFPTATKTNGWWRAGVHGDFTWETPTHNGGGCVFFLLYEMLARVQTFGADNAWDRFKEALNRYGEPDRYCGGTPLYRGETTRNVLPLENGAAINGAAPAAFVHAFIGAAPDHEKLVVAPNLPDQLDYIGIHNLAYRDCRFDIKASHGQIEIKCTAKPLAANVWVEKTSLPDGGGIYPTNRIEIKVF